MAITREEKNRRNRVYMREYNKKKSTKERKILHMREYNKRPDVILRNRDHGRKWRLLNKDKRKAERRGPTYREWSKKYSKNWAKRNPESVKMYASKHKFGEFWEAHRILLNIEREAA